MPSKKSGQPKASQPITVISTNKWDGVSTKNALDDAIRHVIVDNYGYKESHYLLFGRIFVSLLAVGVAGFACLWDYLHPFPASKNVLIICPIVYFILTSVLQLYSWYVESNTFLVAYQLCADGSWTRWKFQSHIKKYDHMYNLTISRKSKSSYATSTISKSIGTWIAEDSFIELSAVANEIRKCCETLDEKKIQ